MAAFSELGVMGEITKALEEIGWQLPSPIQSEAIPLILGGGDVMGAAETGTGKTGAFGIPILQMMHEHLTLDSSAGAGPASSGGDAGPEWRMSTEDRGARLNVDATGLTCAAIGAVSWEGGRATCGVTGGRVSFEVECVEVHGTVRVGFATMAAAHALGTCAHGFGFGGTGMKSNGGKYVEYGCAYGHGDVVGCHLDLEAGEVSFSVNGAHLGAAFALPPRKAQAFYPAVCLKNAAVRLNFGAAPLRHAPPRGFAPIAAAPRAQVRAGGGGGLDAAGSLSAAGGAAATPLCIILEPSRDLAQQASPLPALPPPRLTAPPCAPARPRHSSVPAPHPPPPRPLTQRPTRRLQQTLECIEQYKRYMPAPRLAAALLVGGVDMREQARPDPPRAPRRPAPPPSPSTD